MSIDWFGPTLVYPFMLKIVQIIIVIKYLATFNPSHDYVVQGAGSIYAGFSWHTSQYHITVDYYTYISIDVPYFPR